VYVAPVTAVLPNDCDCDLKLTVPTKSCGTHVLYLGAKVNHRYATIWKCIFIVAYKVNPITYMVKRGQWWNKPNDCLTIWLKRCLFSLRRRLGIILKAETVERHCYTVYCVAWTSTLASGRALCTAHTTPCGVHIFE